MSTERSSTTPMNAFSRCGTWRGWVPASRSVVPGSCGREFLGFLPIFRITSVTPRSEDTALRALGAEQSPWDGPIEAQLVHSRDGLQWNRFEVRSSIIPRGEPESFDAGCIISHTSTPSSVWSNGIKGINGQAGAMRLAGKEETAEIPDAEATIWKRQNMRAVMRRATRLTNADGMR